MSSTLPGVIHSPLVHTILLLKLATCDSLTFTLSLVNKPQNITDTFYPKSIVAGIDFVKP